MQSPLRAVRQAQGRSLEDVAKAVSVSSAHLSMVETGRVGASVRLAERLAEYFGRDLISEIHILYPERFEQAAVSRSALAQAR